MTTVAVDSVLSGNWNGYRGNAFFTPLVPGAYRVKVDVPKGYVASDPDSVFQVDGWSDTLSISGGSLLDLGTILLLPEPDTTAVDTVLPMATSSGPVEAVRESRQTTFKVYPNPTAGTVKIDLSEPGMYTYVLYNRLGQHIREGVFTSGEEVNLRNYPGGLYYLRFRGEENIEETVKVMVVR